MPEEQTLITDRAERLDQFLARSVPEMSRSKLVGAILEGLVRVEGVSQRSSFRLKPGLRVTLEAISPKAPHDLTPYTFDLDVRFEDEYLLIVNKPRGMAVHPAASLKEPSLVNALLARSHDLSKLGGDFRPGIVHRLDKDTTGLILVAKSDRVHAGLASQIESKSAKRRYLAVVGGVVELDRFDVSAPLARNQNNRLLMGVSQKGKHALTHFKRLAQLPCGTLIGAALETGRTHQIRAHLQSVGMCVLGDRLYAPKELRSYPLQLHAAFLSFLHPHTGNKLDVYAEPPLDFVGAELVRKDMLDPF